MKKSYGNSVSSGPFGIGVKTPSGAAYRSLALREADRPASCSGLGRPRRDLQRATSSGRRFCQILRVTDGFRDEWLILGFNLCLISHGSPENAPGSIAESV
jgi:hypothetical protein